MIKNALNIFERFSVWYSTLFPWFRLIILHIDIARIKATARLSHDVFLVDHYKLMIFCRLLHVWTMLRFLIGLLIFLLEQDDFTSRHTHRDLLSVKSKSCEISVSISVCRKFEKFILQFLTEVLFPVTVEVIVRFWFLPLKDDLLLELWKDELLINYLELGL